MFRYSWAVWDTLDTLRHFYCNPQTVVYNVVKMYYTTRLKGLKFRENFTKILKFLISFKFTKILQIQV